MNSSNNTSSEWTFLVSTKFPCNEITDGLENYRPDPIWRTTALGCKVLELLQDMYEFHMIYEDENSLLRADSASSHADIYARPRALSPDYIEHAAPIQAIIQRRYGFIVRASYGPVTVQEFYTLPFTRLAWFYLFLMCCFIIIPFLYLLGKWEKRVTNAKQEYSLLYVMMVVFGACCQHIPPIMPILVSRRLAYFVFFMYAWMAYSYYTSNLLSHLVNEKEKTITIEQLTDSDYQLFALDGHQFKSEMPWYAPKYMKTYPKIDLLRKKLSIMKLVDVASGLTAVGTQKVAFLSDFITVYPYAKTYLDNEAICDLIEINIFTNIKEYIYTSKTFPLKEEFKVGMLRIFESGVLWRIRNDRIYSAPKCQDVPNPVAGIKHVAGPLLGLGLTFIASAILLLIEKVIYERNKVWPYVN